MWWGKQETYIPLALDWNISSNSCRVYLVCVCLVFFARIFVPSACGRWSYTNRKYQHLAYFHTFAWCDARLNKEISFARRLPEAQTMLDYISNQINGPFFLFFFRSLSLCMRSTNGGKNKNLSLFQHLFSFIAFANRPQYMRASNDTHHLRVLCWKRDEEKNDNVNDLTGIFMSSRADIGNSNDSFSNDFSLLICDENWKTSSMNGFDGWLL